MKEIVWKNPWSDRFLFLEAHIPENVSIVDFGCGNKQILDYCSPSQYLGIDLCKEADVNIDLNNNFNLEETYDTGLILGLLEHVKDAEFTLKNCIRYADNFLVLTSSAKKKKEWNFSFSESDIKELLEKYFNNVQCYKYPRYTLSIAKEKK
jgi:hypothetical protein